MRGGDGGAGGGDVPRVDRFGVRETVSYLNENRVVVFNVTAIGSPNQRRKFSSFGPFDVFL